MFPLFLRDHRMCLVDLGVIITLIHHFTHPRFPTSQVSTELVEGVGLFHIFGEMLVIVKERECVPFAT